MGSSILKGITAALLVTVLTLFAGIVWVVMHLGGLTISQLLDIGLLASCLVGGFRAAKDSGEWLLGGIVGASYVTLGTLLLTFFLPVQGWGFIQVLGEGAIIGSVAGVVGAGGGKGLRGSGKSPWSENRSRVKPYYSGYETNDRESDSSQSDWYQEEDRNDWRETSNKGSRRGEESPDVQWSWDKEEVEEPHDWKEATITTEIERSENPPEVEWPWTKEQEKQDKQEEPNYWKEAPITHRIESSKKSSRIKWPWSKDKELVDSEIKYDEPTKYSETRYCDPKYGEPRYGEPKHVEPRYVVPLRISASGSKNKASVGTPWWEQ